MFCEACDAGADFFAELAHGIGGFESEIASIFGEIEHAADLAVRDFGDIKEAGKILIGPTLKTLCNVIHHGNATTLDLVPEAEIPVRNGIGTECVIDAVGLNPSVLPNPQVFEAFCGHGV